MSEKICALVFKVFIPLAAISFMVLLCYPVCNRPEGFNYFLFWILVGFPFGIRRMLFWLIPKNYDIGGSIGVLAVNCIVGGLIGGIVAIITVIKAIGVTVQVATGRL